MGLWGWMSASGPGELTEIEERLASHQYVKILDTVILPTVRIRAMLIPPPQPIYIAMDNAPTHSSQAVKEWFREHLEVIRLPWPPKSPDLNPIENLWAQMAKIWDSNVPRNKQNLIAHAKTISEDLRSDNLCRNLVMSVPRRLGEVIDMRGFSTKY